MAKRLAEKVRQEFRPDASGLFVLTATQAGTLGTLGLPPEVSSQVLSLNWLREQAQGQAQVDMDMAEEEMGAVTETAEKDAEKTQEKPKESRQAALF